MYQDILTMVVLAIIAYAALKLGSFADSFSLYTRKALSLLQVPQHSIFVFILVLYSLKKQREKSKQCCPDLSTVQFCDRVCVCTGKQHCEGFVQEGALSWSEP